MRQYLNYFHNRDCIFRFAREPPAGINIVCTITNFGGNFLLEIRPEQFFRHNKSNLVTPPSMKISPARHDRMHVRRRRWFIRQGRLLRQAFQ